MVYKQINSSITNTLSCIQRLSDNAFIPLAVDNSDYIQFKKDLSNGAELQDASGNIMTATQIQTFLQGLK
jgi:hypothetical protein